MANSSYTFCTPVRVGAQVNCIAEWKILLYFNYCLRTTGKLNSLNGSCLGKEDFAKYSTPHVMEELCSWNCVRIVTDLLNALPGNSSVNAVQHATIDDAVFSVDPTDVPIDWLDNDHIICVYCSPCPFRSYKISKSDKSLKSETVKYGLKFQGNRTREKTAVARARRT
jgi:hypothetical protein